MGKRDQRIDDYISKSEDFAKPILRHIRKLVHAAVPEVEEAMKWSFPHFLHKGMLCSMASFKKHCAFGFWKESLVLNGSGERDAMGQFGRITSLDDLPADRRLSGYIKKAAALNDEGVKVVRKRPAGKKALVVPADLEAALKGNKDARRTFDAFSPSNRREYVEWLTEAKTDRTRQKRLDTAVAWMAEGKSRNWKYL
jgi:uncharacterized protein YdeI (YjbR/CyaY-like superfamily)